MERRFDMTKFEQSLKDQADQFKMIPSRKVWRGIYNDLHPGRKWPSISMGLIFLFTLIGIGHLNNSSKQFTTVDQVFSKNKSALTSKKQMASFKTDYSRLRNTPANPIIAQNENAIANDLMTNRKMPKNNEKIGENTFGYSVKPSQLSKTETNGNHAYKEIPVNGFSWENQQPDLESGKASPIINKKNNSVRKLTAVNANENVLENNFALPDGVKNYFDENKANGIIKNEFILPEIYSLDNSDPVILPLYKNFLEENKKFANLNNAEKKAGNKPTSIRKKRNEKISWIYFVIPKITSVYFKGKAIPQDPASNFSPLIIRSNQMGNNRIYNARLGFETGTEMTYKFAGKWQFVTGANISYSGYNVISDRVHPTFANLVLKGASGLAYTKGYISQYGNGQSKNQISLPNYNLQVSIPVGLQYAIWRNKNVKINLASTIQPSFVINSNAYLLSSDGRNYVSDPDLMRKVNLSANFGSSVTFKSKKVKWHIGPSVRYQVLSTYKNIYPVKEHLIDYGIRIGISK